MASNYSRNTGQQPYCMKSGATTSSDEVSTHSPASVIHAFPSWLPRNHTWMYNQVKFLPDNIETHIVCESTQNLQQFNLPNIHSLDRQPKWNSFFDRLCRKLGFREHLFFLENMIRKTGATAVHSHFGPVAYKNLGAIERARVKHLVTFYGADVKQILTTDPSMGKKYHRLFESVDRVLCEGQVMAADVQKLGCPASKIRVHHLGVDLERLPYVPRHWNPDTPLRILISGTFREKKGIPYALHAIGQFARTTEVQITIIGDANPKAGDAEEKAIILKAIADNNLKSRTSLLGFQPYDKLIEAAYEHHIFISPSVTARDGDSEGGAPLTIVELAASGMPIVSTKHCDIPDVILDGTTGWLAPERDVDALAEHLRWLASHPEDWRIFLDRGRSHIEKEYSCERQGKQLAKLYLEMVAC